MLTSFLIFDEAGARETPSVATGFAYIMSIGKMNLHDMMRDLSLI